MRKRDAWFVWYISSLYWQASTSSGRARRCSPINGLAAHITVVFLHRQIKNSILNRQPWDVMHNTCSKSIETLHCLLNCCFQHEPRLSSSIYFCFRRELQEISGRRIPFLSLKHVKIKKVTWSADPNQWPDFFFHPLPKLLMEVMLAWLPLCHSLSWHLRSIAMLNFTHQDSQTQNRSSVFIFRCFDNFMCKFCMTN